MITTVTSEMRNRKEYVIVQEMEEDIENEKQIEYLDSDDCYSVLYLCDAGMDEIAINLEFFQIIRKKENNLRYKFKLAKQKTNHDDDISLLNSIQFIEVKSKEKTCYPLREKESKGFMFRDEYLKKKLPPDGFYSIRETNDTHSTTLFNINIAPVPISALCRIREQSKIKLTSVLRYVQRWYDLQNLEKGICDMRASFFTDDYFEKEENLLDPKLLFPLFHLFALRDMKFEHVNQSIEMLAKIGDQADKIWNYLIELPSQSLEALKKYEKMWNDSLKEAEENGILQHSIVFILRNQIRNRTVSQLSIRYFFIDLGISCSIMKNNEMFMDIILLSNLLFNWNKFGK